MGAKNKQPKIAPANKVGRIKKLIQMIMRHAHLTAEQKTTAMDGLGRVIVNENLEEEELQELQNWIKSKV